MNDRTRILVRLALAFGLAVPGALAQKAPAPTPSPSPAPTAGHPNIPNSTLPLSQPNNSDVDRVMFLTGRIAAGDGSRLPNDTMIERVCNQKVRQQVYASSRGDFSMQLGSISADSFVDASGDPSSPTVNTKSVTGGIPRRELQKCELRASASGFRPSMLTLIDLTPSGDSVDVGAIVVERAKKVSGTTLSATAYKAPDKARRAYEKGLDAEQRSKLPDAQKYFEQAVAVYPEYVSGWYRLGAVLQKQKQNDAARGAYLRATTLDPRFLPPYVALAAFAYQVENWPEVIRFTNRVMELDPLNQTNLTSYVVDLDPLNSAEAYFYNAVANYKLNKLAEAEKSAIKAEHLDLATRFPQLHLLMAQIFVVRNNYAGAISELQTFLQLVPGAQRATDIRAQLDELEKLNAAATDRK